MLPAAASAAGTPALPGPLAALAPLLEQYGYPALALFVLLDNCGIPAPGQTVLVLAAVFAGTGHLEFAAVVAIAFTAAVLGNTLGHLIGATGGRAFVHRWGRYVLLTPERMAGAEVFFARHGGQVVTVARFVDGLRQTNGIIAGTTGMPWPRFQVFNVLGAALWVGVWAAVGYLAGSHVGTVWRTAVRYQLWLLLALGALAVLLAARYLLRGPRGRARWRRDRVRWRRSRARLRRAPRPVSLETITWEARMTEVGTRTGPGSAEAHRAPANRTVVLSVLGATALALGAQAVGGTSARLVLLLVFVPALLAGLGTLAQTLGAAIWVTGVIVVSSVYFPPESINGRALTLATVVGASVFAVLLCARRVRREHELHRMRQSAVALQRQLLRPLPALTPDVLLHGRYRPIEEDAMVGGDLYDIADTPYGTRVVIGDVQGKGLPAIGTGFAVLGAFREAAFREPALTDVALALEAAVTRHNAYAAQSGEVERFVTATVLCLDRTAAVQAVNCGHLAPYLLTAGTAEAVPLAPGVPLGLADLAGEVRTVQWFDLPADGTLVLLTDGVTEAQDRAGAFYPVEQRLRALGDRTPDQLPEAVDEDVHRYSLGRRRDDLTVLALRRNPTAHPTRHTADAAPSPTPPPTP
ncbi:SpoIIE family protein phosphatase [Kitasatospora sp. NPDC056184]|uniref:SpoIIE family protein phosphatase n=1 Tax=Kitasatospora sp. NPDC056184 TaxID=3345738 RepID=UPI0035DBB2EA